MNLRSEYYGHYNGYAVIKPQPMVIVSTIDDAPAWKPTGDISHLIKLYRDRGYPLGKSRKGIKKYLKRILLKALGCKSYNEAMRKSKRRNLKT